MVMDQFPCKNFQPRWKSTEFLLQKGLIQMNS